MPDLEWPNNDFNFSQMKKKNSIYQSEDFFPPGIDIQEPKMKKFNDDRKYIFLSHPETPKEGSERVLKLIKTMNARILNGHKKRICYLVVSHRA